MAQQHSSQSRARRLNAITVTSMKTSVLFPFQPCTSPRSYKLVPAQDQMPSLHSPLLSCSSREWHVIALEQPSAELKLNEHALEILTEWARSYPQQEHGHCCRGCKRPTKRQLNGQCTKACPRSNLCKLHASSAGGASGKLQGATCPKTACLSLLLWTIAFKSAKQREDRCPTNTKRKCCNAAGWSANSKD